VREGEYGEEGATEGLGAGKGVEELDKRNRAVYDRSIGDGRIYREDIQPLVTISLYLDPHLAT
jgi:hypothetical protein